MVVGIPTSAAEQHLLERGENRTELAITSEHLAEPTAQSIACLRQGAKHTPGSRWDRRRSLGLDAVLRAACRRRARTNTPSATTATSTATAIAASRETGRCCMRPPYAPGRENGGYAADCSRTETIRDTPGSSIVTP